MSFDARAFELALLEERSERSLSLASPISFEEQLHPRDPMGKFREVLDKLSVEADKDGVELWVTPRSTGPDDNEFGAVLEHIQTMPGHKGTGKATKWLKKVTDAADKAGAPVALNVGDPDFVQKHEGALSKPQLTKWYKRHGWVPNKGRNKDFAFTHAMIRPPRA
jgi:GNAT superfamily N-acetyltransferase